MALISLPKSHHEILLASLGRDSLDAFAFVCAFSSADELTALVDSETTQHYLNVGLRAAYNRDRAENGVYLLGKGADPRPLVATVGVPNAQDFFDRGLQGLMQEPIVTPVATVNISWTPEREKNDLRLLWTSWKPTNHTVLVAIEGCDNSQPGILHLQALHASLSPTARLAWMQFDLEHTLGSSINRVASIGNVQGTPLHWAVDEHGEVWKNREVLAFLLRHGAEPHVRNHRNQTPRDCVREQLKLPDECLSPKAREYYSYAHDALAEAERADTSSVSASVRKGFFTKLKNALGN